MKIVTTFKVEIQKANTAVRLEIKQANAEVLKTVEQIYTTFQSFMLKAQADNLQNQDMTQTSSQQTAIT